MQKPVTLKRILVVAGILSPALVLLVLIIRYAINVPYSDDYSLIPMFQSLDHGHMPWGLLWAQHNEHRYFFPLLIILLAGQVTHFNIIVEIYLSFLVACVGFAGIVVLMRRHIADQKLARLAMFLAATFFFSPVQAQNWLWGFQLGWFLCTAGTIWAVNLLDALKPQDTLTKLIAPGALAFFTTFTLGGGFLVWFGGLIVLILRKLHRVWIGSWLAGAAASLGLYYFNYRLANEGLAKGAFLHDLPAFVQYFFAFLGRPVANDDGVAVFVGLYLLVIFVSAVAYAFYKKQFSRIVAFVSLGGIALAVGLLIGVSRFNYGMGGALSGVHTTFSVLFIIAVIGVVISLIPQAKRKRPTMALVAILIIVLPLVGYGWVSGISDMRTTHKAVSEVYTCSREPQPDPICLYRLDSLSAQEAQSGLNYLRQKHYGGY